MQSRIKNPVDENNSPIGKRLKLEMKKRGITSANLAKRAGVKTSFIYDVISGKSANPSTVKLARVADSLGISLTSLVENTGTSGGVATYSRPSGDEYVTIPRVTVDASAGGGTVVSQEAEGESYFFRKAWIKDHLGAHPSDLRMLYIRGDSMEPTLCNNDIILIDTTKKIPTPPGIFVLFDGGGLVAKRIEYMTGKRPARIRIISDNPHYSVYERSIDETCVIGRVVWFAREI